MVETEARQLRQSMSFKPRVSGSADEGVRLRGSRAEEGTVPRRKQETLEESKVEGHRDALSVRARASRQRQETSERQHEGSPKNSTLLFSPHRIQSSYCTLDRTLLQLTASHIDASFLVEREASSEFAFQLACALEFFLCPQRPLTGTARLPSHDFSANAPSLIAPRSSLTKSRP